jgi:hypothetical protein
VKPPLAQFQATRAVKPDVLKLLGTLNKALGEDALEDEHIKEAFEFWWPKLEAQLKVLPEDDGKKHTHRPDRELLEEILSLVRNQARRDPLALLSDPLDLFREDASTRQTDARNKLIETEVRSAFFKHKKDVTRVMIRNYDDHSIVAVELADREVYGLTVQNDVPVRDMFQSIEAQVAKVLAAKG